MLADGMDCSCPFLRAIGKDLVFAFAQRAGGGRDPSASVDAENLNALPRGASTRPSHVADPSVHSRRLTFFGLVARSIEEADNFLCGSALEPFEACNIALPKPIRN